MERFPGSFEVALGRGCTCPASIPIIFDTEKFIYEVEQRPAIYDVQSKDYSNRQIKAKAGLRSVRPCTGKNGM